MSSLPTPDDRTDAPADPEADALTAVIAQHADEPAECTLFPAEATDAELVTTWISAAEGSFVSLAESR